MGLAFDLMLRPFFLEVVMSTDLFEFRTSLGTSILLLHKKVQLLDAVFRNYDKVLIGIGKLSDNIRVTKTDSCLVLTECFSRQFGSCVLFLEVTFKAAESD